jgi:hypothetical protein
LLAKQCTNVNSILFARRQTKTVARSQEKAVIFCFRWMKLVSVAAFSQSVDKFRFSSRVFLQLALDRVSIFSYFSQRSLVVLVFHLLGGFAINSSDDFRFLENGVEKLGESILQIGKREFFRTRVNVLSQGDFNSPFIFPNRKIFESLEKRRFVHRAPCRYLVGGSGDFGEESEQNDGEVCGAGMRGALFEAENERGETGRL